MKGNIDRFITGQISAWTTQESAKGKAKPLPVIAISREYGAFGSRLARHLGQQLGFEVWDDEILSAVSQEVGAPERFLTTLDERSRSAIADMINGAILGGSYMVSEYLQALFKVVHTLATHGGNVIVGRGANYILKPEDCLRIRVVRPPEERVADIAARHGLSEKEARAQAKQRDRERQEYLRQHFRRDGTDPADYDLVINAGMFSLEACGDLVKSAYRLRFGREPQRRSGSYPAASE